jgi:uncharacterized protein (TIGR03382 family)
MRAFLLVAALVAVPRLASANFCNIYEAQAVPTELPLGCPLTVYVHPDILGAFHPELQAVRLQSTVPLTATHSEAVQSIDVAWRHYPTPVDCDLLPPVNVPTDFHVFTFDIADAQVGDGIRVSSFGLATVVAAGPCPTAMPPTMFCDDPIQSCGDAGVDPPNDPIPPVDGHRSGCSASGTPGLAGLALAGLIALRRRRR